MILPLWVQGLTQRRWPYVTTAIIVVNFVVFLATHDQMERDERNLTRIELPMLLIAAAHPEIEPPPEVKPLIDSFAKDNKDLWDGIRTGKQPPMSLWEQDMREWGPNQSNAEMTRLARQIEEAQRDSLTERYAFHPYRPSPISFITANFLHGGWLHLIFNMWFLWLAGTMMEDVWGPFIYTAFYFLAGVAGLVAHATTYPHSILPVLGASGAIAGLIGAFLVRFPDAKIDLLLLYFRFMRVAWPAYFVLPLWLLVQVFWGSLVRGGGGVAYWAHIGGFLFGAAMAIALRHIGIERPIVEPAEA